MDAKVKSWQVAPDTTVQVVDPMGAAKDGSPDSDENRHNWPSIIISLSIIVSVLVMVAVATLLMGPQVPPFFGRRLRMADLYDVTFQPQPMAFQWLPGDKLAYMSEGAGVRLLDLSTGTNITLVTGLAVRQTAAVQFSVSADLRYVLLCHDVIKGRLYTRTALYSIYNVDTNHYYPLTLTNSHPSNSGIPVRLQHAQWAASSPSPSQEGSNTSATSRLPPSRGRAPPGGGSLMSRSRGNALLLVHEGTVYYQPDPAAEPVNLSPDSQPDSVTYGMPDLLYKELLQEEAALWPSPSGHALLVASFNDSSVRELPILHYGGGYPSVQALRYPTVDSPLPDVILWLYDLASPHVPPSRTRLLPPQSLREGDHYLVGGGWADDGRVWATWVGGNQASSALTLCSAPYWFCSTVLQDHRAGGVSPVLRGVQWAGKWAAFPWPAADSQGTWHNHVALVGEAGGRRAPLTSPRYHVEEVMDADLDSHLVYFRGTELADMKEGAYSEQVYRTSADGSNEVTCCTCHLRNKNVLFAEKLVEDEEEGDNGHLGKDGGLWEEWTDVIRDIYTWRIWGAKKSYGITLNFDRDEIDKDYDLDKVRGDRADTEGEKKEGEEEEKDEEEMGSKGEMMYRKCSSVHGSLSPSKQYMVATCYDDDGVPPSLWLLDLTLPPQEEEEDEVEDEEEEEVRRTTWLDASHFNSHEGEVRLSKPTKAEDTNGNFGNQEKQSEAANRGHSDVQTRPPLLLHSQTNNRLAMGVLGMPSTLRIGVLVGGGVGVGVGEGGRRSLHARITLTVPPGWASEDTSLLYPLVVQMVGPDEPPSSSWAGPDWMGVQWPQYLASGHQVAHARVQLWGSDPSTHTSAHGQAEYHVDAVRQLLTRLPFLDGSNVAVYGRGGSGATVAMEAAALTPPLFQCVVLVNPVTDWHAHGVYWSERILGPITQEGAEQRYVESNIARLAPEFRNSTPVLLVHGTADQYAHHGFSLAHALNAHAAHFTHVVYPEASPAMLRPSRHLLAELEHFLFSWLHDPLIYEDTEGNIVDDTVDENMRRYENRFDIKRSFGKHKSS